MTSFRFNAPVIVSPAGAAPYAARFAQVGPTPTLVYVRGPQGLHMVLTTAVTPRTLGIGDAKAARHSAEARS